MGKGEPTCVLCVLRRFLSLSSYLDELLLVDCQELLLPHREVADLARGIEPPLRHDEPLEGLVEGRDGPERPPILWQVCVCCGDVHGVDG